MRRVRNLCVIAAAAAAGASGFSAQAALVSTDMFHAYAQPKLVVAQADQINDPRFLVGAGKFTGVGGLIVNTYENDQAGFVGICSGAFISPTIFVTAAHCLSDDDNEPSAVTRLRIRTGAGILPGDIAAQYEGTGFLIHPGYGGLLDDDIAFVQLGAPVSNGEDIYGIYRDRDELGQIHTKVGFGTTGEGTGGTDQSLTDFRKRAGPNIYEVTGNDVFGTGPDVLLFDFDSGSPENDVFGFINREFGALEFPEQTGVRDPVTGELIEVNSSPGDSGGPTFIQGLIAGITSFGLTGAVFQDPPQCGPGQLDPDGSRFPGPDIELTDQNLGLQFCTNSSFGELSGDTRVSSYADFIDAVLAGQFVFRTPLPEPGALGLIGLGLVGLVYARRRRR